MLRRLVLSVPVVLALAMTAPRQAHAGAEGVGLGVAGGVAYSTSDEAGGKKDPIGARFAWGFFVDIPLLSTFYITPSTMIYKMNAYGFSDTPVTDVDLNFKFIVPIGSLRLGAGLTGGLSVGIEDDYVPHYGVLGQVNFNVVANLDAFVMVQYKHMMPDDRSDVEDVHGFVGGMFYF